MKRLLTLFLILVFASVSYGAQPISVADKQLLSDGNMEAATTGSYTAGNLATLTKGTTSPHSGSQVLRIAYNGTTNPYASQSILTIGKTYAITGWARSGDGVQVPVVGDGAYGSRFWTGDTSTSWQHFDVTGIAYHGNLVLQINTSTAGCCEFDDVYVTEYTPPISVTDKQVLADGNMELSGVGAWAAGHSATLTKETTNPHSGSQVLRVAYNSVTWPYAAQSILTANTKYRIKGWLRGDGGNGVPRLSGNAGINFYIGTTSTSWQYVDVVATTTGDTLFYCLNGSSAAGYAEFDDITVTEYTPPISVTDKQVLADGNMEASGVASWAIRLSAILTKETTNPHSGSQCLRITYGGGNSPQAYQNITAGKSYRLTGWARSDGIILPKIYHSNGTSFAWTGTTSTAWQYFDETFTTINTELRFYSYGATGAGEYTEWDDVFVTEL